MELVKKSLQLDISTLSVQPLSLWQRVSFIMGKYLALVSTKAGGKGTITLGGITTDCPDAQYIGTLQSSIVDLYADIIAPKFIARADPVIVDIGANIGQFCRAAKLLYPKAQIYSFEPDPDIYTILQRNTNRLPDVHTFNLGLGEREQKQPFYVDERSSLTSSFKKPAAQNNKLHIKYLDIQTLDQLLQSNEHIDLLKIDVEGYEMNVIRGAVKTLEKTNYLLMELSLDRVPAGGTNLALLSLIHKTWAAFGE